MKVEKEDVCITLNIMNYTSIEQSKKLLSLGLKAESADMCYTWDTDNKTYYPLPIVDDKEHDFPSGLPCWSLAALLGVLPVIIGDVLSENALRLRMDKGETEFAVWYDNLDSGMVEGGLDIIKSNAVDACYEMVIRLNELKML